MRLPPGACQRSVSVSPARNAEARTVTVEPSVAVDGDTCNEGDGTTNVVAGDASPTQRRWCGRTENDQLPGGSSGTVHGSTRPSGATPPGQSTSRSSLPLTARTEYRSTGM